MQSGGLNRERLYQAELNRRERDRDDSLIVMIRTGGSLMCTSFSSFHVLNRVNIVHLIYTSNTSITSNWGDLYEDCTSYNSVHLNHTILTPVPQSGALLGR